MIKKQGCQEIFVSPILKLIKRYLDIIKFNLINLDNKKSNCSWWDKSKEFQKTCYDKI